MKFDATNKPGRGFTLLEMLVVIAIIGILAGAGLPAIKSMSKSNTMASANRQLLDDIAFARSSAMANHTTVYMVFVPPWIADQTYFPTNGMNSRLFGMVTNLYSGQYTTYSLVALRSVGDQPGQRSARYLTGWKTLPTGVYIATNKFYNSGNSYFAPPFLNITNSANVVYFPFPVATNFSNQKFAMPFIAFNYLGQLVDGADNLVSSRADADQHMYIPLVRGSIFYNGFPPQSDIVETPAGNAYYSNYNSFEAQNNKPFNTGPSAGAAYNQIYIDPLTGRARVEHPEIQ